MNFYNRAISHSTSFHATLHSDLAPTSVPSLVQRRFFLRSCSSPADSRLLSLITTVAISFERAGNWFRQDDPFHLLSQEHSRFSWVVLTRCLESRVAFTGFAYVGMRVCIYEFVEAIVATRAKLSVRVKVQARKFFQACINTLKLLFDGMHVVRRVREPGNAILRHLKSVEV